MGSLSLSFYAMITFLRPFDINLHTSWIVQFSWMITTMRGLDKGPVDLSKSGLTLHSLFPCTDLPMIRKRAVCTCFALLRSNAHCPLPRFHCATMQAGTLCEACICRRSKISWDISDRSVVRSGLFFVFVLFVLFVFYF